MPHRPLLVFCVKRLNCPLVEAMREATGLPSDGEIIDEGVPLIAGRVLRVRSYVGEGYSEVWIRVSGEKEALSRFMDVLSKMKAIYHQVIYENRFNKIIRVVVRHDSPLACPAAGIACPLQAEPPGTMLKSSILIPGGVLQEYIVARGNASELLENGLGCRIVDMRPLDEMDYMLTQKQELALVYAYMSGYYNFPRRTSLKALAQNLGLSVSTLAEFLRRAEAKVIEAFIRHELPHYMVARILHGRRSFEKIEEALRSNGNGEARAKAMAAAAGS